MRIVTGEGKEGELETITRALMKQDESFENITLSWSSLGDRGANIIGHALRVNYTLRQLDLFHNDIGPDGATSLALSLEKNTTLHTLNMSWNSVGVEGAWALVQMLDKNTTLTRLDLTHNNCSQPLINAIDVRLRANKEAADMRAKGLEITSAEVSQNKKKALPPEPKRYGAPAPSAPPQSSSTGDKPEGGGGDGEGGGGGSAFSASRGFGAGGSGAGTRIFGVPSDPATSKSVGSRFVEAFMDEHRLSPAMKSTIKTAAIARRSNPYT